MDVIKIRSSVILGDIFLFKLMIKAPKKYINNWTICQLNQLHMTVISEFGFKCVIFKLFFLLYSERTNTKNKIGKWTTIAVLMHKLRSMCIHLYSEKISLF